VEECDERFTAEQIEEILEIIQRIVPAAAPTASMEVEEASE
jgi:hypothetical protein